MTSPVQRNKRAAQAYWQAVDGAGVSGVAAAAAAHLSAEVVWQGFAPLSDTTGCAQLTAEFLQPFADGFDGLDRQIHILMGGVSDGRAEGGDDGKHWVGATGYLVGRQTGDLCGVPATNRMLRLRWGEFLQFNDQGRIVRIQTLIDVIDWLEQIGLSPLPAPRGAAHVFPAPTGVDGILLGEDADTAGLMTYARQFIFGGLNAYEEGDLGSMGMAGFFHPNLKWYGPGGIGACLSFREFEDLHQAPWLVAFPDRKVGDLDNLIVDGPFVGASSLPGVHLTHTGPYLGHLASGRRAGVKGIDFWLYQDGTFTENWVFVDMVDLFSQFGIDLMARVGHLALSQGWMHPKSAEKTT